MTRPDPTSDPLANPELPLVLRAALSVLSEGRIPLRDLLDLDVRDLDPGVQDAQPAQSTLTAADAKRGIQARPVPISEETADLLREIRGERDAGPLFAHQNGFAWSPDQLTAEARRHGLRIHEFRKGELPAKSQS